VEPVGDAPAPPSPVRDGACDLARVLEAGNLARVEAVGDLARVDAGGDLARAGDLAREVGAGETAREEEADLSVPGFLAAAAAEALDAVPFRAAPVAAVDVLVPGGGLTLAPMPAAVLDDTLVSDDDLPPPSMPPSVARTAMEEDRCVPDLSGDVSHDDAAAALGRVFRMAPAPPPPAPLLLLLLAPRPNAGAVVVIAVAAVLAVAAAVADLSPPPPPVGLVVVRAAVVVDDEVFFTVVVPDEVEEEAGAAFFLAVGPLDTGISPFTSSPPTHLACECTP
jgi:hypothetical protein